MRRCVKFPLVARLAYARVMHPRRPFLVLVAFALFAGCASVPQYRPIYDLPADKSVEVGVVPQLGIGFDQGDSSFSGVLPGATAWGTFRTAADLDLFVAGHGGVGVSLVDENRCTFRRCR